MNSNDFENLEGIEGSQENGKEVNLSAVAFVSEAESNSSRSSVPLPVDCVNAVASDKCWHKITTNDENGRCEAFNQSSHISDLIAVYLPSLHATSETVNFEEYGTIQTHANNSADDSSSSEKAESQTRIEKGKRIILRPAALSLYNFGGLSQKDAQMHVDSNPVAENKDSEDTEFSSAISNLQKEVSILGDDHTVCQNTEVNKKVESSDEEGYTRVPIWGCFVETDEEEGSNKSDVLAPVSSTIVTSETCPITDPDLNENLQSDAGFHDNDPGSSYTPSVTVFKFTCTVCQQVFQEFPQLQQHNLLNHDKDGSDNQPVLHIPTKELESSAENHDLVESSQIGDEIAPENGVQGGITNILQIESVTSHHEDTDSCGDSNSSNNLTTFEPTRISEDCDVGDTKKLENDKANTNANGNSILLMHGIVSDCRVSLAKCDPPTASVVADTKNGNEGCPKKNAKKSSGQYKEIIKKKRGRPVGSKNRKAAPAGPKSQLCAHCGKVLSNAFSIRRHVRIVLLRILPI